jgi:hypothetical protein
MANGSVDLNAQSNQYLAAPNPCYGSGSEAGSSIPFREPIDATDLNPPANEPSGAGAGGTTYSYAGTGSDVVPLDTPGKSFDGSVNKIVADYKYDASWITHSPLYPSVDFSIDGECNKINPNNWTTYTFTPADWLGEFDSTKQDPFGQHLHFLFYQNDAANGVSLAGGSVQNWWGIVYNPTPTYKTFSCGNACQITIAGGSGGGGGPPMIVGQIIADNVKFTGNSTVEIYYRPCILGSAPCGNGPGTALVE